MRNSGSAQQHLLSLLLGTVNRSNKLNLCPWGQQGANSQSNHTVNTQFLGSHQKADIFGRHRPNVLQGCLCGILTIKTNYCLALQVPDNCSMSCNRLCHHEEASTLKCSIFSSHSAAGYPLPSGHLSTETATSQACDKKLTVKRPMAPLMVASMTTSSLTLKR